MLKKCLKYDLRAVHRIWWILAVTMVAASAVVAICIRALAQNMWNMTEESSGLEVLITLFGGAGAMLGFIAMVACLSVSVILVYWRTYTHFYTDEGYLTFTLPVKRSTLYLSKVITAAIVELSTGLLFVLGIALILLVAPPTEDGALLNPIVYTGLADLLGCSLSQAKRIKASGLLAPAISQLGRVTVIDTEKALALWHKASHGNFQKSPIQ